MTDLKEFVSGYRTCLLKFVPDVPDNGKLGLSDSAEGLQHNSNALQQLLKRNLLVFLCEVVNNDSLSTFLETFLQARPRAIDAMRCGEGFKLVGLVALLYMRLLGTSELNQIPSLLPSQSISVSTKAAVASGKENSKGEDQELKRQRALEEEYKQLVSNVRFARAPQLMDLIAILGDSNVPIAGKLLDGFCAVRPAAQKELTECMKLSVKALEQVQQSMIVLSRRVQESRQPRRSGVKQSTTKVSGLSVAGSNQAKRGGDSSGSSPADRNTSKLSAAAELTFLCEFAVDIVYTLSATLAAANHTAGSASSNSLGVRCLEGTHLTGNCGLPLLRGMQNVYEVLIPLAARTASLEAVDKELSVDRIRVLLGVLQAASLQTLHDQLTASLAAIERAVAKSDSPNKTLGDLFDSMDVMREDAVDWMAFFNGFDPLGRDVLTLTANSANAGESASGKLLSAGMSSGAANAAAHSKASITAAGVVHTVEESEVLRGAFLTDYVKVYGSATVEAVVRHMLGADADTQRVEYVLASLQGTETLLHAPEPSRAPARNAVPEQPAMAGRSNTGNGSVKGPTVPQAEMVSNLKSLFPDLGEGFIEACIAAYKGNMEEIVDALLTNNLPPKLLLLDRGLQKVWIGKGGNASRETVSLDAKKRDSSVVYKAVDDANFKQLQLERVRKMEAEQEYDALLLSREYNDDYDDQYDDQIPDPLKVNVYGGNDANTASQGTGGAAQKPKLAPQMPAAPLVVLNRRDRRKLKGQDPTPAVAGAVVTAVVPVPPPPAPSHMTTAMIHQQMAEMKRLNTLTKEAEVEAAYWEGMRNTNRPSAPHSGKGGWKAELLRQEAEAEAAAQGEGAVASGARPAPPQGAARQGVSRGPPGNQQGGLPRPPPQQQRGGGDGGGGSKTSQEKSANPAQTGGGANAGRQGGDKKGAGKGPRPADSSSTGGPASHTAAPKEAGDDVASVSTGAEGAGDAKKRHRSKPYDKHHQKDRSVRKFSHFAPST